jgi:exopolysaccharide biosynthesis protein
MRILTQKTKYFFLVCLLLFFMTGCSNPFTMQKKESNQKPSSESAKITSEWLPGMAVQTNQYTSSKDLILKSIIYARFDPKYFDVEIQESQPPKSLQDWCKPVENIAVINGGYFMENYQPTALLISDKGKSGKSYIGKTKGMFFKIKNEEWGIRNLAKGPGSLEKIEYALQTFPMLIEEGKNVVTSENGASAKRSFVAIDQNNKLIIGNTENSTLGLNELADQLSQSKYQIKTALNLDGGASSGMCLRGLNAQLAYEDYSLSVIPYVIVVKMKK